DDRLPVRNAEGSVAEPGKARDAGDLRPEEPGQRGLDDSDGIVRLAATEHRAEVGERARGGTPLHAGREEAGAHHAGHAAPERPLDEGPISRALDYALMLQGWYEYHPGRHTPQQHAPAHVEARDRAGGDEHRLPRQHHGSSDPRWTEDALIERFHPG